MPARAVTVVIAAVLLTLVLYGGLRALLWRMTEGTRWDDHYTAIAFYASIAISLGVGALLARAMRAPWWTPIMGLMIGIAFYVAYVIFLIEAGWTGN